METGVERVLTEEAWRNERVLNRYRVGLWLGTGAFAAAMDLNLFGRVFPGAIVSMAWGLVCIAVGFLLRRRWHALLPVGLTIADLVLFGIAMHDVHLELLQTHPAHATAQLHSVTAGVLLILASNMLRFSATTTVVTAVTACLVHGWLMVTHGALGPRLGIDYILILGFTLLLLYRAARTRHLILRVKERDALARFLPEPLVEALARDPTAIALGGNESEGTVLFADIRGFTTLAESMPPAAVVRMLNEYFAAMVDEIFLWQGILDKFIGDGICAVFVPVAGADDHPVRGVRCAQGMLARLERLNAERAARGDPALAIGVGLHAGRLIAGNIGSPRRMEYTHVGDVVNTASRLEGLSKALGAPIILSDDVHRRSGVTAEAVDDVELRGKAAVARVWRLS